MTAPRQGEEAPGRTPELPATVLPGPPPVVLDRARRQDVPAVVALLRDDVLGAGREPAGTDLEPYLVAFRDIDADDHQLLVVARAEDGTLVGTMQLTLLRSLSRQGATRLQVEAVRVAAGTRGGGLGRAMMTWAAEFGRSHGATLAQLTSDRRRTDAHRFYESLGWVDSHKGMKLPLHRTD